MRLRNIECRVANLEQLLGRKVHEQSTDFDRQVTVWLIQNDEYRRLAQQIFERGCESEQPVTSESFNAIITTDERQRMRQLTEEAEVSVRAELSSADRPHGGAQ